MPESPGAAITASSAAASSLPYANAAVVTVVDAASARVTWVELTYAAIVEGRAHPAGRGGRLCG